MNDSEHPNPPADESADTAEHPSATDTSATDAEANEPSAPATDHAESPVAVKQNDANPPAKKPKVVLCPYCGHAQQQDTKCSSCGGLFEPLSRRATQIAMGPWSIRNRTHPFRPGCSYEVLVKMIEAGRVGPMTVLRGPTTRQFWSVARNVPGVAHLLGYCHACGAHVSKDDPRCPSCDAVFRAVKQRNELGLQFPNRRAAEAAQRSLNRLLGLTPEEPEAAAEPADSSDDALLSEDQDQVLAAAASAPGETPESIFEQDAKHAAPRSAEDDEENDLISDLLGEAGPPRPRPTASAPKPVPPATSSNPDLPEQDPDAAPRRADTPSPLRASAPAAAHPAALPPRRPINWLVILLIALNVLVAAVVIVYVATRGETG